MCRLCDLFFILIIKHDSQTSLREKRKRFVSTHILINFLKFKHLNDRNVRVIYEELFYQFKILIETF